METRRGKVAGEMGCIYIFCSLKCDYAESLCTVRHFQDSRMKHRPKVKLESLPSEKLLFHDPPGYLQSGLVKFIIKNTPVPYDDITLQHISLRASCRLSKVLPARTFPQPLRSLCISSTWSPGGSSLPEFDGKNKCLTHQIDFFFFIFVKISIVILPFRHPAGTRNYQTHRFLHPKETLFF